MKLSKRTTLFLLLMVILINIVLRYPRIPHEIGMDSFTMHSYANTIMQLGRIPWTTQTLSYFGLYPNSYPAGGPALLASVCGLTGLSMETTVFVVSGFLGVFSCLGAFMLAGAIIPDNRFKILVAFMYSTSPLLLKYSIWTFSTRVIFFTLLPLFLWAIFNKLDTEQDRKMGYYVISFLLLLIMAASHRLFWMALLFAFIIVLFNALLTGEKLKALHFLSYKIKVTSLLILTLISLGLLTLFTLVIMFPSFNSNSAFEILLLINPLVFFTTVLLAIITLGLLYTVRREKKLRFLGGLGMLSYLISIFFIQYTKLAPYRSSWYIRQIAPDFIDISTMAGEIIALGVVIGARYGLLLIPAVLGLVYLLVFKKLIKARAFCVLATIIALTPFLHFAMYFHETLLLMFILIAGLFFMAFFQDHWNIISEKKIILKKIRKHGALFVVIFLIGTLLFSVYTTNYRFSNVDDETGFGNVMTADTYNTALFAKDNELNVTGGPYYNRVSAISGQLNTIAFNEVIFQTNPHLPELSDMQGWYNFLKRPFGSAEVIVPHADWPVHAIIADQLDTTNDVGYVLFANSEMYLVSITNEW